MKRSDARRYTFLRTWWKSILIAAIVLAAMIWLLVISPRRAAALGTILVAIVAVFGDWIRSKVASPDLEINLAEGEAKNLASPHSTPRFCRYLKILNSRPSFAARNVRIMCTRIEKSAPKEEPWVIPLQMRWIHTEGLKAQARNIHREGWCDLGCLGSAIFRLCVYEYPPSRPELLQGPGTWTVSVKAYADNFTSKEPYRLAIIRCDEKWPFPAEEIEKHLQIREVKEGSAPQTCSAP